MLFITKSHACSMVAIGAQSPPYMQRLDSPRFVSISPTCCAVDPAGVVARGKRLQGYPYPTSKNDTKECVASNLVLNFYIHTDP